MKRFVMMAAVLSIAFVAGGCGDSHEALVQDSLVMMEDINEQLASIKDKDSCEAAIKELKAISDRAKLMKERGDKLGKMPEETEKALKEKYEPQFKKALEELQKNAQAAGPTAMKAGLAKELMESMSGLEELGKLK
jgi:outer membrane murein-binding lipoprotein Lpp